MKEFDGWDRCKQNTCIHIENLEKIYSFDITHYTEQLYTILSLNDYKKMNDIKEVCEFKRGERIMVRDYELKDYEERIFLAYIE